MSQEHDHTKLDGVPEVGAFILSPRLLSLAISLKPCRTSLCPIWPTMPKA